VFGPVIGPRVFPFVFIFFAITSLTQWALFQFVTVNYGLLYKIFAGFSIVAIVTLFFFNEKPDWARKRLNEKVKKLSNDFGYTIEED